MSNSHAVDIVCSGDFRRIPIPNPYINIEKLKNIVANRFHIDYPFNLTYNGAHLCEEDTLYDLALHPSRPIIVRRHSIDDSYTTNSNSDIFVSYEPTHRSTIQTLRQKLEERNYSCWIDVDQISGSTNQFCSAIEQGIQQSTVFLCCITDQYVQSNKCRQELNYAKQNGKRILLLLLEQITWPPPQIASLVSGLSHIEFYHMTPTASVIPWPADKFDELLDKLATFTPQL